MTVTEFDQKKAASVTSGLPGPTLSIEELRELAAEGRRRRQRFEKRVAPLKVLTAEDLRIRAR